MKIFVALQCLLKTLEYQNLFVIYADLECLTEKIDGCKTNPEYSSTTKVGKHIPSLFFNVCNIMI